MKTHRVISFWLVVYIICTSIFLLNVTDGSDMRDFVFMAGCGRGQRVDCFGIMIFGDIILRVVMTGCTIAVILAFFGYYKKYKDVKLKLLPGDVYATIIVIIVFGSVFISIAGLAAAHYIKSYLEYREMMH